MLKYEALNTGQKELYNSLKDAIQKNNGNVADVLKDKAAEAIALVVGVVDENGNTLLIDAIKGNDGAAKKIREKIDQENISTGHATDALESKAVSDIFDGDGEVTKKILNWASPYKSKNVKMFIENKLNEEFKDAVKSGDFEKANILYEFGERNKPNIFKDELLIKNTWLSNAITEIKRNEGTKFLENTLKFAKENNILDEVFKAEVGSTQKTLLEFAEEKGVKKKVEGVIRDAGINISQYENAASSLGKNQKILNFLCKNKEKIAFGGVGLLLVVGCIAAAYTLGQPLIGIGAVVGAAMMLMSVLAITTVRGYEMWGSAKNLLNDLFVSKPGPTNREI